MEGARPNPVARRLAREATRLLTDVAVAILGAPLAIAVLLVHFTAVVLEYRREMFEWRWRILCWVRFGMTYDRRTGVDGRRTAVKESLTYTDETYDHELRLAVRRLNDDRTYVKASRDLAGVALGMGLRSVPLLVPRYFDIPTPAGRAEAPGACAMKIGMTPVILASRAVLTLPEDERTAIFQHELTHLARNDAERALHVTLGMELLLFAVRMALCVALTPLVTVPLIVLARYAKELIRLKWHRSSERRADRSVDADLRPALARALVSLDEDLQEMTKAPGARDLWWRLEDLWLSHPSLWNRLEHLEENDARLVARRLTRH